MNKTCPLFVLGFCLASLVAPAQETGANRQSVRLNDPSRPALVKAALLNGSIRVRAYDGKEVLVEARPANGQANGSSGLAASDLVGAELLRKILKVEQEDNVVTVRADSVLGALSLDLQVPAKTSLKLSCQQAGEILVEKVEGEIEANGLNGSVRLLEVSGTVVAHSLNGQVKVTFRQVAPDKPMSFTTLNGDVDVTLPAETRATVKLETLNGSIQSDFEIQPKSGARRDKGDDQPVWSTEKTRSGTINGGGPEFQLKAFNGSIHLRKNKIS